MAAEIGDQFALEQAVQNGMLPLLFGAVNSYETLQAYVGLYLKEEVQAEGLVRSLENFSRFLEIVSFSHACQLNVTNLSQECEVKRKTDAGVFRVLRPKGPLDRVEEIDGVALEGLVAQHLKAWRTYSNQLHDLSFWRTRTGIEVDFVVYGLLGFWALEV